MAKNGRIERYSRGYSVAREYAGHLPGADGIPGAAYVIRRYGDFVAALPSLSEARSRVAELIAQLYAPATQEA